VRTRGQVAASELVGPALLAMKNRHDSNLLVADCICQEMRVSEITSSRVPGTRPLLPESGKSLNR
jgi:hypothetical protein